MDAASPPSPLPRAHRAAGGGGPARRGGAVPRPPPGTGSGDRARAGRGPGRGCGCSTCRPAPRCRAGRRRRPAAPDVVPRGVVPDARPLVGRVLAGAVRAGEPLTDARLVGPGLTALLPPDLVAAPVRLADLAVAALVRTGDRVDVLAALPDAARAEVVAGGALVLAAPRARVGGPRSGGRPARPRGGRRRPPPGSRRCHHRDPDRQPAAAVTRPGAAADGAVWLDVRCSPASAACPTFASSPVTGGCPASRTSCSGATSSTSRSRSSSGRRSPRWSRPSATRSSSRSSG